MMLLPWPESGRAERDTRSVPATNAAPAAGTGTPDGVPPAVASQGEDDLFRDPFADFSPSSR
jgi:hypothetical protein